MTARGDGAGQGDEGDGEMTMTRDIRNPDTYPKCARCGRPNDPWPLERGGTCSPKDWYWCIRPYPPQNKSEQV